MLPYSRAVKLTQQLSGNIYIFHILCPHVFLLYSYFYHVQSTGTSTLFVRGEVVRFWASQIPVVAGQVKHVHGAEGGIHALDWMFSLRT